MLLRLASWRLLLLVFLIPTSAHAEDRWFAPDKALHFGVSAGLSAGGYGFSSLFVDTRTARVGTGILSAVVPGAAKELYDANGHGDPSWKDFAWDATGALVGVSAALLLDVALAPERPTQTASVSQGLVFVW